jgi:endonuclease/exonuclease/phosphatase family metal-dependent hydrolase
MCHADSNNQPADDIAPRGRPERGGSFRLLTINLGLLGVGMSGLWRLPIDSELKRRLAAAPDLLSAVDADVIALQEVYAPADRQFLIRAMAARYPFSAGSPKALSLVGNGLMVLSRFPILHSEFMLCKGAPPWTRLVWKQGLLGVDLDLPVIGPTRLINVHLAASVPFGQAGSMASEANRDREIVQLLSVASAGDPAAILAGDFNNSPEIHSNHYRRIIAAGYADAFVAAREPAGANTGITWDAANPLNARGRFRNSPSQRIDHVFVSRASSPSLTPVSAEIVLRESMIATPSGQRIPLSDHYGMLVTLAASG